MLGQYFLRLEPEKGIRPHSALKEPIYRTPAKSQ
jgi:hypothetical protein